MCDVEVILHREIRSKLLMRLKGLIKDIDISFEEHQFVINYTVNSSCFLSCSNLMRGTKFLKISKYLRVPFYGQNIQGQLSHQLNVIFPEKLLSKMISSLLRCIYLMIGEFCKLTWNLSLLVVFYFHFRLEILCEIKWRVVTLHSFITVTVKTLALLQLWR